MSTPFDLCVESALWRPKARWHALFERALAACAAEIGPAWLGRSVSFLLCDDRAIRAYNRAWRGLDKATNVLSFPLAGHAHPDSPLGDVAIAFETAAREAQEEDKPLSDHVAHLVVHGVLHLVGYDHETTAQAEEMEASEQRVLARLGIPDPYRATEPVEALEL